MGQTATTIRIDADLKAEFDKLCEEFGMSANTAFNIYLKTVVRQRRIPFTIEADPIDEVLDACANLLKHHCGCKVSIATLAFVE